MRVLYAKTTSLEEDANIERCKIEIDMKEDRGILECIAYSMEEFCIECTWATVQCVYM